MFKKLKPAVCFLLICVLMVVVYKTFSMVQLAIGLGDVVAKHTQLNHNPTGMESSRGGAAKHTPLNSKSQEMELDRDDVSKHTHLNAKPQEIESYRDYVTKHTPLNAKPAEKESSRGDVIKHTTLDRRPQISLDHLKIVEERNKVRLERIKKTCLANVQPGQTEPHVRAIMDPNHTITYCRVNKVASTYTLEMLTSIFNCSIDCLRNSAEEVTDLPYRQMREAISKSFKFTFVREPYGRLFSTYSNKFYFPKENWAPIGPRVVKRYRNNPSMDSLKYGHDITFAEMIRFTIEEYEAGNSLDEHLRPMYVHCFPCDYQYDFIGKLETMKSDWTYLKDFWSIKKHIAHVPDEAGEKKPTKHSDLKHILKTLVLIKGSTISRYKLYLRAWSYYQIIGDVYKHIRMPFKENSHIKFQDFQHALDVAVEKSEPYAEETKAQKIEAMKQAYASVPMRLLHTLKRVVALDCRMYGYEHTPEWVFDRNSKRTDFDYFKGLD